MSIEATSWALQQQAVTDPAARSVLFGLANHANHEGRHAFPSVDLLCRYTGLGRRTVIAKLKFLQGEGLIRRGNQKVAAAIIDRADRRPVVYDLALGMGIEVSDIGDEQTPDMPDPQGAGNAPRSDSPDAPDAPRSRNGVQMTTPRGARAAPEPSLTNPNSLSSASASIFDEAAQRTDDGEPLTGGARQFPMSLDWEPDAGYFAAACLRAGLPADTTIAPHQLAKFTAHHADMPNRRHGAMAWTAKLVDWIRNDARQANTLPTATGGTRHADSRQRTPARRLTAAEARERDRERQQAQSPGGIVYAGQCTPADR